MKYYNTQAEIDADCIDGNLIIDDDITILCNVMLQGNIKALNIEAGNIEARNIEALNINAKDIDALNIKAADISYYASAIAYSTFRCTSVRGRRENSFHRCLDSEIEIIQPLMKTDFEIIKELYFDCDYETYGDQEEKDAQRADKIIVRSVLQEIDRRAQELMLADMKVEGKHYAAMCQVAAELGIDFKESK